MADFTLASLTAAAAADGTETLYTVQGGLDRKMTAAQLRTYAKTGLVKADVGLANVDNTADTAKPVSTAQQAALDTKAPLASPAFTGTPTGITKTHVGLGNVDNTSDANKPVSTAQAAADALKENIGSYTAGINTQTGTAYTLVLQDIGRLVEMNNAAANTITVPPNSSVAIPIGSRIDLEQYGAGQTAVAAGAGVTIRSSGAKLKLTGQYSGATLIKRGSDEWVLVGDIAT